MALHVNYKNRMGYCYVSNVDGTRKAKIWFCHANALCAIMNFYKAEEDGKKVDMVRLHSFLLDLGHAKNCIKADLFKDYSGFTFFAKELTDEMWKLIKMMTKHGIKVTIK